MISLEDEAKIAGRNKEKVTEARRFHAACKDNLKYGAIMLFGSLGGVVAGSAAYYYYPEDITGTIACSGIALLSGLVASKSVYELGRFTVNSLRSVFSKNPDIMRNYLQEQYPEPNLLPPVFVDERGELKD